MKRDSQGQKKKGQPCRLFYYFVTFSGCGIDPTHYHSRFDDVPESEMTEEQRLLHRLMRKYDKASRPVYEAAKPVMINLGITLTQVLDMVRIFASTHFRQHASIKGIEQHHKKLEKKDCEKTGIINHHALCLSFLKFIFIAKQSKNDYARRSNRSHITFSFVMN